MQRYAAFAHRFRVFIVLLFALLTLYALVLSSRIKSPSELPLILGRQTNFERLRVLYQTTLYACDDCTPWAIKSEATITGANVIPTAGAAIASAATDTGNIANCSLQCGNKGRCMEDASTAFQYCSCASGSAGIKCEVACDSDCNGAGLCQFSSPYRAVGFNTLCQTLYDSCTIDFKSESCLSYGRSMCPKSDLCDAVWKSCLNTSNTVACALLTKLDCTYDVLPIGTCSCVNGTSGGACELQCPGAIGGKSCSNNGICIFSGSTAICKCNPG
jgi:hypothetical protein